MLSDLTKVTRMVQRSGDDELERAFTNIFLHLQKLDKDFIEFRVNSGKRDPETIIKKLKRDQKILRTAWQLLDEDVAPRDLTNKIKRRLRLSIGMTQIRRIYRGK